MGYTAGTDRLWRKVVLITDAEDRRSGRAAGGDHEQLLDAWE